MRRLLLAGLLLGPALSGAADSRVLAPAPGGETQAPALELEEDQAWKVCRLRLSLLATAPGRSLNSREVERIVALGESAEVEQDLLVPVASGQALIHVKVRVRAAAARSPGATYLVSSEGVMRSALGFSTEGVGDSQFRSDLLDFVDGTTQLFEVFARADLGLRVMLAAHVSPAMERDPWDGLAALRPPEGDPRRMDLEAYLKEGETLTLLDRAALAAHDGRSATYSLSRFSGAGRGGMPAGMGHLPTVSYVRIPGVPTVDVERVASQPADDAFQRRVEAVNAALHQELTSDLGARKLPGQYQVSTPRKISKKKREAILEMQRRQDVRDWAIERSKTLPQGEVPEGFQREELSLTLTPLRGSVSALQLEIVLRGQVKLPREEGFTAIDVQTIESVVFGETLELGLADLVRGGDPEYDYVLRITCQP